VLLLEPSKSLAVTAPEGVRYRWQVCDLHGLRLRVCFFAESGVCGKGRVELADKPLIRDVALAIRGEPAEDPHGDCKRESEKQQTRGEPQPTVVYFLPPLWPLPPLLPLPPP
jgi:hypothetical protein